MRVKKYISIVWICILIYSLSGCGNSNIHVSNTHDKIKKIEVAIIPELNKYSAFMSSTPGLPLTVRFKENINEENIKFHWVTEQGTFLDWQQDTGKISVLGKDIRVDEKKLYWSIDPYRKINKSSLKIYLKIEDKVTSKVISQTSIEVEQSKEGIFTIKE